MQEKISAYVATLTVQGKSGYELAARESATYFDGRGIYAPGDSDWEDFKKYYRQEYRRKKGEDISETTLQENYVRRGKAFYRWCLEQGTPSLIETEATTPAADDDTASPKEASTVSEGEISSVTQSALSPAEAVNTSGKEAEKPVRTSLLIDAQTYKMLSLLAALENKTMTEILTAGARLYIGEHSHEAAKLQEAIEARSR